MVIETLYNILEDNRAQFARQRELNARAGQAVFVIPSQSDMATFLVEVCAGARCTAEIPDLDMLRLPPIDAEIENKVLKDNPDFLTIDRETLIISYDETRPRAWLSRGQVMSRFWQRLPNTGVKLPSGRDVRIIVEFEDGTRVVETDIVRLKEQCSLKLLRPLWERWLPHAPLLSAPNLNEVMKAEIPPIKVVEFARSPVDNTPLMAYGTIALNEYSYLGGAFKSSWHMERADAEAAHAKAVNKLALLKSEAGDKALVDAFKRDIQAAVSRLTVLRQQQSTSWFDAPSTLRSRYDEVTNSTFKYTYTYMNDVDVLRAMKKKVDTVLAEIEERFKPAPVAQASIAALSARFGTKPQSKSRR